MSALSYIAIKRTISEGHRSKEEEGEEEEDEERTGSSELTDLLRACMRLTVCVHVVCRVAWVQG